MMNQQIKEAVGNSKLNRFHILLTLICMFVVLTEGYDLVIYGSIKGQIIAEWGIDKVTAGLLGSAALLGMMAGSFSLGILADLLGRKRVLVFCLTVFSLGTGLAGFTHSPLPFALCRFIAGLGIGGAMPNAIGLLSDYILNRNRNILIATAMAGMQIGGILSPVISLALGADSWRICLWLGFVPLLMAPVIIKQLPDSLDYLLRTGRLAALEKAVSQAAPGFHLAGASPDKETEAEPGRQKLPVRALFQQGRARNTGLFWVAFFMGLLMIYGLNTWLPDLMFNAGYDLGSSLTFLIALNSAALLGSVILGRVADRVNTRLLLVTLYWLGAVSMMLLAVKSTTLTAYILISLCGICVFGCQNIGTAFVAGYYPSQIRSTALGVCNTVGRLGGILGPTLGGVLMAAALSMTLNCLAFALPGLAAGGAYLLSTAGKTKNQAQAAELGVVAEYP